MFQVTYWFFMAVVGIGFLALFLSLCDDVIRQQKNYNEEQKRRKARVRANKRMKKEIQEEIWKDYPTGQVPKEEKHAKTRRKASQ